VREMSIGENYDRNIIPVRSDISRFSRGTNGQSDLSIPVTTQQQFFGRIRVRYSESQALSAQLICRITEPVNI
jgi:hypothetical protein